MKNLLEKNEEWQFKGIKRHHILIFPILKDKRRETLEETLNQLSAEEKPEYSVFPRTTPRALKVVVQL